MKMHYGWVIVAAGALITCIAVGSMFALPVFLQPISETTGWSRAAISASMTLGFLVMGVAGFGWGAASDRFGARPVVLIAAVLLGCGLVLASRAQSVITFQLAYGVLVGIAGGAFFAPLIAATTTWFEENRSLAVSLVSVGAGVGPMTVSPFAGWLSELYGWRTAMFIIAIAAWAILIPVSLLIRRAPALAADPAPAGQPVVHEEGEKAEGWQAALRALRTPQFIVLAVTFFLCCGAHSGPIFHTVSYAMLCGVPALAAISIYSVEGLAGLAGRLILGIAADRIGAKPVLVAGLLVQAVAIGSYVYVRELTEFYAVAAVLGMAYGGVMPLYAVLARDHFGPHIMGTVFGAATMASSIGMAFGPVAGGWLFDRFGDYSWLYMSSAAIGMAAVAVALIFPAAPAGRPRLQPA